MKSPAWLNWLFIGYALLTVYIWLRAALGLPFLLWPVMALPLLGVAFSLLHAANSLGWRAAGLFLALTVTLSLALECLGVATGLPFGAYHYTDRLGPLFLGLVPVTIPLSWFQMLYPSAVMAGLILYSWSGRKALWWQAALLGGAVMTAWDLVLDPLMVFRQHWVWEQPGGYFGIPWQNYAGWWLTASLILLIFNWSQRNSEKPPLSGQHRRLAVGFYAVTGLGHVTDAGAAGLWGPALVGGIAIGLWSVLAWKAILRR